MGRIVQKNWETQKILQLYSIHYNHPHAAIAQLVERIHGKDEVTGSTPVRGSIKILKRYTSSDSLIWFNNMRDII